MKLKNENGTMRDLNFLKWFACILFTAAACNMAWGQQSDRPFKKVEFGFNIGYLGDLQKKAVYDKPLSQVRADGITNLRIYEPFTKNITSHPEQINRLLSPLVQNGFKLLISISNYPDDSLADLKKPDYAANKDMLKFTNRYAPNDTKAYNAFLTKVLNGLRSSGLLNNISFEIGNEPDAKKYFWDNPSVFINLAKNTREVLSGYNRPVYCCAFTSEFANNNQPDSRQYADFLRSDNFFNDVNLSFHLYPNNKYDLNRISLPHLNGAIISEFNLFSYQKQSTGSKNTYFNSANFGSYLIELLGYAYERNIKAVYFFCLVDLPRKDDSVGFFDSEGNPKPAYAYFKQIYDVVRDGYTIKRSRGQLIIIGHNKSITYSTNGRGSRAFSAAVQSSTSEFKQMGQWTINNNAQ